MMAEKPGVRAWRQPTDRKRGVAHDALARTVQLQERWSAANRRQRDIITRLTQGDEGLTLMVAETLAQRKLCYDILRETGLTHEEAEEKLSVVSLAEELG